MDLSVKQFGDEQTLPCHRYGPHVRDYYLIHYVLHGKGTLSAEGAVHHIGAGQAFVIFPGQVTIYQADMHDPWHYGWIGFDGDDAGRFVSAAGATPVQPIVCCHHNLFTVIHQMQQDVTLPESQAALTGGLLRFLALLCDSDSRYNSSSRALYEKALWYFRSNYSRPVTVEETAHYVGLSRSQLFRIFRNESGQSPKQVLTDLRLEEAYRLLLDTGLTVQEISYAVGIPASSRFCALFSARYGLPPGQFVKRSISRSPAKR